MKEYVVYTKTYTRLGEFMVCSNHEVLAESGSDACAGILNSMPTVFSDIDGRLVTFVVAASLVNPTDEAAQRASETALAAGYKARFM